MVLFLSFFIFGSLALKTKFIISNVIIIYLTSGLYFILFKNIYNKEIVNLTFRVGLFLRIICVYIYYYVFFSITNTPFEVTFADSIYYDEGGKLVAQNFKEGRLDLSWMIDRYKTIDKIGYQIFLGIIYYFTNNSILIARLIQALISAYTIILAYKICRIVWGEYHGRSAAILFSAFHPFILYSTLHLREFLLVFLFLSLTYNFISILYKYSRKNVILLLLNILALLLLRSVYIVIFFSSALIYISIYEKRRLKFILPLSISIISLFFVLSSISIFDTAIYKILGYIGIEKDVRLGGYTQDLVVERGMSLAKLIAGPLFILPSIIFPMPSVLELTIDYFGQSMHWYFSGGLVIWVFLSRYYFVSMYNSFRTKNKLAMFILILIIVHSFVLLESYYFTSIRFNQVKMALVLLFVPSGLYHFQGRRDPWLLIYILVLSAIILFYNYLRIFGRGL